MSKLDALEESLKINCAHTLTSLKVKPQMPSKQNETGLEKKIKLKLASLESRKNLNLKQFGHHTEQAPAKRSVVYKTTYKQAIGAPLSASQRQTEVSYRWG